MGARLGRGTLTAVMALLLAVPGVAGLIDASSVAAAPSAVVVWGGAPVPTPTTPVPGDSVTFTGRVPQAVKRPVRLQVRRDGAWRTVARSHSDTRGRYVLRKPVPRSARYRVEAPRLRRATFPSGRTRAARLWRSAAVTVTPKRVASVLALGGRSWAEHQDPVVWTATLSPVSPGRQVLLEIAVESGGWQTVGSVPQASDGAVAFAPLTLEPGEHLLRARAPATTRLAAASASAAFTVLEPATADPVATGALPRLDITTEDGEDVRSKTVYSRVQMHLDGTQTSDGAGTPMPSYDLGARLRVRGNSTSWAQVKLPYKVKLDTSTSLFGMPASKDWVLLANFFDRSLMRNEVAFDVARRVGVPWAPRMYDVEVWLNGTYRGVYQLGEGIEVAPGRVDLDTDELPADPADGGFLLEADHWDDTDPNFRTTQGIRVHIKELGADTPQAHAQVQQQVQQFEDALYGEEFLDPVRGYRPWVDLRSFADWYLVNEVTKNVESNFNTSVWFKRDFQGTFAMGPPWDFDQSAGYATSFGISDPTVWFLHWGPATPGVGRGPTMATGPHGSWINRMLEDPEFRALVAKRWEQVSPRLHAMIPEMVAHADRLAPAAERNFAPKPEGAGMWLGPSMLDGDEAILHHTTWRPHADDLATWYAQRIAWLDSVMPALADATLP